eukprot:TRINITY_DN27659_c0_g1_i1.p1 TRINITY_DN27659_c0_g1~~TRINITY_DN27659_c0_g1_i1.p1  ORF type:complete len:968 (-),score=206.70 TRINITY_DN27659_c0_g1_i1:280-3183(-)
MPHPPVFDQLWKGLERGLERLTPRQPDSARGGYLTIESKENGWETFKERSRSTRFGSEFSSDAQVAITLLLNADVEAVTTLFAFVERKRPELLQHCVSAALAREEAVPDGGRMGRTISQSQGPEELTEAKLDSFFQASIHAAKEASKAKEWLGNAAVQFSSGTYYCSEGEAEVHVEVLRTGEKNQNSEVWYETMDLAAKSGVSYTHVQGKVVFEPGANRKTIAIPLLEDDRWDTSPLDFAVRLKSEGRKGCGLAQHLSEARVEILDDDTFPNNAYKEAIEARDFGSLPRWSVIRDYYRWNYKIPEVRSGTIKMLLCQVLHQLYGMFRLFLNVYLIDYVLKDTVSEDDLMLVQDRRLSLLGAMGAVVVPFIILHVVDFHKYSWRVVGHSRSTLMKALLRKMVHFDEQTHAQVEQGDLIISQIRDTSGVVECGYMSLFQLAAASGELIMMMIFQVLSPFVFKESRKSYTAFLVNLIFPLAMLLFSTCRESITHQSLTASSNAERSWVVLLTNAGYSHQLFTDYQRRNRLVDDFGNKIYEFNNCMLASNQVLENNAYFAPWLSTLLVAIYTFVGGMHVLMGDVSLGIFVTDIHIFIKVGHSWQQIYSVLMNMSNIWPKLERLVFFFNLPIDLIGKMRLHRHRHSILELSLHKLQELPKQVGGRVASKSRRVSYTEAEMNRTEPIDEMPIMLSNVTFGYGSNRKNGLGSNLLVDCNAGRARRGKKLWSALRQSIPSILTSDLDKVIDGGKLRIQQGELTAIVGPRGEGKSTLLRILGGRILPVLDEGSLFFMPSHLRVIHVSGSPMFIRGSLYENLTFGVENKDHPNANKSRVLSICRRMSVKDSLLNMLKRDDTTQTDWDSVLSESQKQVLSLARAFIANPELLCLNKPTSVLDSNLTKKTMMMMLEFVKYAGIDTEGTISCSSVQRPRTLIFTCACPDGIDVSDRIVKVSKLGGIEEIRKFDVTPDMVG